MREFYLLEVFSTGKEVEIVCKLSARMTILRKTEKMVASEASSRSGSIRYGCTAPQER